MNEHAFAAIDRGDIEAWKARARRAEALLRDRDAEIATLRAEVAQLRNPQPGASSIHHVVDESGGSFLAYLPTMADGSGPRRIQASAPTRAKALAYLRDRLRVTAAVLDGEIEKLPREDCADA